MTSPAGSVNILFSICVVTYKRPGLLKQCLDVLSQSLCKLNSSDWEVIVSDDCPNHSAKQTVLCTNFASWTSGPNRGIAANRNHIATVAQGKWIIFIDDDELPHPEWLDHLHRAILTNSWDVIEGQVVPIDFPDSILWYAPVIKSGGAFCSANLAIRKSIFHDLGGFNENLSVSHEDIEMGNRIRMLRPRCLFLEEAIVYHPARQLPLFKVLNRMIDLQVQSYLIKANFKRLNRTQSFLELMCFTLKYWLRVTRLELAACQKGHWKRQAQSAFLLLFTIPVGFYRLLLISVTLPHGF